MTRSVRIGRIPYLNCEPFFAHLEDAPVVSLMPRQLGLAVAAGAVDAAPLSLVDVLRLGERLVPLPFGIAAAGPARSVLLFSDRPLAALEGAVVGVTDETSTSVELLRVLLAFKHHVRPRAWVGAGDPCDALLLIGDAALRARTGARRVGRVVDLGSEWFEWTRRPFVFARWAVRAEIPEAGRAALAAALDAALERGLAGIPAIARRRCDTGLAPADVEAYLRGFAYRLGAAEDEAAAEFARLLDRLRQPDE
jgi:chorismate dehydratase